MIELIGKYATAKIFAETIEEGVYGQVYDIINCPAFAGQKVVCMPDVHVGASGPCGLVATIGDYICPEHIGVDIGCSVSMMVLDKKIPVEKYPEFEHRIKNKIPFGFNINGKTVIDEKAFYRFLTNGFNRYRNFWPEMLAGLPDQVDERWVTAQLKRLGMDEAMFYKSLGTVGGGNHFIEYDEEKDGNLAGVTLHFGSRNFGVKVCKYWMNIAFKGFSNKEKKALQDAYKKDYVKAGKDMRNFLEAWNKYFEENYAHNHINGYLDGENMKGYLCDMCFAQLYAAYNHWTVQNTIKEMLAKYGIAICEGLSNAEWLNACAHGAGRKMSRSKAKENISLDAFKASMKDVYSTTVCKGTIDESPMAYKDSEEIQRLITETCTVKHLLVPKINIKATDEVD